VPKIKRYWPCSHGFNRDPQIQELRRKYADWMGYVWQEMCAIADLNDGEIKGTPEQIGLSLAYISLSNRPRWAADRIAIALQYMVDCGWIEVRTDRVLVVNYAKYHTTQTEKKIPPNDRTTEHPNYKEEQATPPLLISHPPPEKPKVNAQHEEVFRLAKEIAGGDKQRAAELCNFVGKTVREGIKFGDSPEVINDAIIYTFNQLKLKRAKEGPLDNALIWPYLQKTYKFKRTAALQAESERYKREPMQKAGEILNYVMGNKGK